MSSKLNDQTKHILIIGVLLVILIAVGPFKYITNITLIKNNINLYYFIWFVLIFPYLAWGLKYLVKYYVLVTGYQPDQPDNGNYNLSIRTAKDVAAILLVTITVLLLLAAFKIFKVENYSSVQEQLIAILGLIGGAYAAAKNEDNRNTLGLPPFTIRALASFLALVGIIFGTFTDIRVLFLEIIAIAIGRSVDPAEKRLVLKETNSNSDPAGNP